MRRLFDRARISLNGFLRQHCGILIIVALFLAVRSFFLLTRYHLPGWDESVFIGMGKFLYSGGRSGLWEIARPIGLPLVSGFLWFAGVDPIFFGEVVAILFAAATIWITHSIIRRLFTSALANVGAALLAVAPVFFYHSGQILTDIPSAFFALVAISCYIDRRIFLAGAFTGVAFLFRFPMLILALPVAAALLTRAYQEFRKGPPGRDAGTFVLAELKEFLTYILPVFSAVLLMMLFNAAYYHSHYAGIKDAALMPFLIGSLHQNVDSGSIIDGSAWSYIHNALYYVIVLGRNHFVLLLFIPAGILFLRKRLYRDDALNVVFLSLVTFLVYFTCIASKYERYAMLLVPLAIIGMMLFFQEVLFVRKNGAYDTPLFLLAAAALLVSGSYASIVSGQFYFWQHSRSSEPPIVTKLYSYFHSRHIQGTILTTDPVFAAFSDNRFLAAYDYAQEDTIFASPWEVNESFDAAVYSTSVFPRYSNNRFVPKIRMLESKVAGHDVQVKMFRHCNGNERETLIIATKPR